jgi:hypothetical protein
MASSEEGLVWVADELWKRRCNRCWLGAWRIFLLHAWQIGRGALEVFGQLVVRLRRVDVSYVRRSCEFRRSIEDRISMDWSFLKLFFRRIWLAESGLVIHPKQRKSMTYHGVAGSCCEVFEFAECLSKLPE